MKLAERIFKRKDYKITSPFGQRQVINTKGGLTNPFHNGCDYGTYGNKWPQYAVESGTITTCGTASDGAKYIWVEYPRLGIKCLHYHLDSIKVKKGQKVDNNTIIGYTGMTGKATGIHLHLGLKKINGNSYIDPESYNYKEGSSIPTNSFFPSKGYFSFGDTHANVGKIASFMYKTFPAYTKKEALGNYYGKNIKASITEFQKRTGLEADGCIGPKTLAQLVKYGFKY